MDMGPPISKELQLISFHTVSKGYWGECGQRGGYFEMTNIPPQVCSCSLVLQFLCTHAGVERRSKEGGDCPLLVFLKITYKSKDFLKFPPYYGPKFFKIEILYKKNYNVSFCHTL